LRIALINSGLGLLAQAAALRRQRPDADLVLAMDPDGMPWGPRTPADIADRALMCARACAEFEPDVLVVACNTASVHALEIVRAEFEPAIAVVGTLPAIRAAAAAYPVIAVWATVATTGSGYQRRLIAELAAVTDVAQVACPGLADAIDVSDRPAMAAAIAAAAARTPAGCPAVVLGCTEYELAAGLIARAVPGAVTLGSAAAVAAQALRRAGASRDLSRPGSDLSRPGGRPGSVVVLLSGRQSALPAAAFHYQEGRLLAPHVLAPPSEIAS
jgi:glutamate racemase